MGKSIAYLRKYADIQAYDLAKTQSSEPISFSEALELKE
jgi:hypothetical protein